MKNPKSTISIIISIVLVAYQTLVDNAELLGISVKLLEIISLFITGISLIWKNKLPEESVFTLAAKHIGTRPKKPRG